MVIHAVVIGGALVYSFWDVDELFSPSVKVTIMKGPPAPVPAPPPPPSPAR